MAYFLNRKKLNNQKSYHIPLKSKRHLLCLFQLCVCFLRTVTRQFFVMTLVCRHLVCLLRQVKGLCVAIESTKKLNKNKDNILNYRKYWNERGRLTETSPLKSFFIWQRQNAVSVSIIMGNRFNRKWRRRGGALLFFLTWCFLKIFTVFVHKKTSKLSLQNEQQILIKWQQNLQYNSKQISVVLVTPNRSATCLVKPNNFLPLLFSFYFRW